jgi:hypothetical protein
MRDSSSSTEQVSEDKDVSASLLPVLDFIHERVEAFATLLTGDKLDLIWTSVAKKIDRLAFDSLLAGTSKFSDSGTLQLKTDFSALISLFKQFVGRPEAFFKQMRDAISLLLLPFETAKSLRVSMAEESENIWQTESMLGEALSQQGVKVLSPTQALQVLNLRSSLIYE